jgi:DNA polymerase-3 subunit gamma/tau
MASTALYRKYRPLTFADVIGQRHIVQTLSNSIKNGRIGHAYLFTGPRGTGKTTIARIFARTVNCQNPNGSTPCLKCEVCKSITEGRSLDIFEIDAASNTGVDNIRELRENVKFPPSIAKYKVYIIDEVHMLSAGAFNALLKTLEEPPAHAIFILATTEIHKVPETIISRCQRYDFTRLSIEHIVEKLSSIAKSEKILIEKNALEMIAISAEGGMRDAESLLSQVMSLEDKKITAKEVAEILGTSERQSLEKMTEFLLAKNASEALALVNKISDDGYDLDVFNKSLLNYLRQIMLVSVDEKLTKIFSYELTKEQAKILVGLARGQQSKQMLFVIQCFSEIQGKIKSSFIPQLPLEMAIIKAVGDAEKGPENSPKTPVLPSSLERYAKSEPNASQEPKIAPISPISSEKDETPMVKKEVESEPKITENEPAIEQSKFSLSDVKKCWNQAILEIKPINHSLSAILQSCQPIGVSSGVINIAAKFPFHKDKLNDDANRLTMESVFAKILGFRLRIKANTNKEAGIKNQLLEAPEVEEQKSSETSSLLTDALGIIGGAIVE